MKKRYLYGFGFLTLSLCLAGCTGETGNTDITPTATEKATEDVTPEVTEEPTPEVDFSNVDGISFDFTEKRDDVVEEYNEEDLPIYGTYTGTFTVGSEWFVQNCEFSEEFVDHAEVPITFTIEIREASLSGINDSYVWTSTLPEAYITTGEIISGASYDETAASFRSAGISDLDGAAKEMGYADFASFVDSEVGGLTEYYEGLSEEAKEWNEDPAEYQVTIYEDKGEIWGNNDNLLFTFNEKKELVFYLPEDETAFRIPMEVTLKRVNP